MEITEQQNKYGRTNASVSLNGNDSYKHGINEKQTFSKLEAIKRLDYCNYRTPPKKVEELLKIIFANYPSKEGHWLYIAQNYNPRAVRRVIALMTKLHQRGDVTIQNPPAYFTYLIKHRKKRRNLASTNGTYKHKSDGI